MHEFISEYDHRPQDAAGFAWFTKVTEAAG
jgi:hypothetical protein